MKYKWKIRLGKVMMYMLGTGTKRAEWLKKHKIFFHMGENCYYHTRDLPAEAYLVSIHDNVQIAANVRLVTHDRISKVLNNIPSVLEKYGRSNYYVGSIEIFDNVMVGANSIIMYNTKIGPNAIVAAGSIVTKDVPPGTVVAGVPAKVIGKFDDLVEKRAKDKSRPCPSDGIDVCTRYFFGEYMESNKEENRK